MRDIKFRGLNEKGEWIYGMPTFDFEYIFNNNQMNSPDNYKVDPNTVSQYTGIKDADGECIYDGDILDFDESEWGCKFEPEVIEIKNLIGDWNYCGSLSDVSEWRRVVGNIHQK